MHPSCYTVPMNTLESIPTRVPSFPVVDTELVIHKANLTKSLIAALVNYCEEYKKSMNAQKLTYLYVRRACEEALTKYIKISSGKSKPYAIDSKELLDRFDFFVDQTSKELDVFPDIVERPTIAQLKQKKKPNPIAFLYYTYLLMPNLDPNYFTQNMNNIRTSVNTLWDRLTQTKHSSLQSMLYLYSTEGGVGKSVFQNIIRDWAKTKKVNFAYSRVPHNQFVGDEYNKNAICLLSDITADECNNWNRMNDLIDGGDYVVEQKGKDRYELKAQAFLIGSSNFHSKDPNNRRMNHSIVQFGATKLDPISDHTAFVLKDDSVDIDYYIDIVDKWICSCPNNGFDYAKYPTKISSSAGDWYEGIEDDYAFVMRAIAEYCYDEKTLLGLQNYKISVATLQNRINKKVEMDAIENIETTYKFSRKQINHILTHLYKRKKITLDGDAKGTYQKVYGIYPLVLESESIKNEKTINQYKNAPFEYDYLKEERVVKDVMNAILKDKPMRLPPEVMKFMKG